MPSPWIWRAIWAIGIVAILVTLAVAALPYIASTQIVRDRIAWEISAWSGFRVTIDGPPQIEVWPTFRATLTDVTMSQWTDTKSTPVIEAERVEIDLSAMAALRGNIAFSTARLIRPTIHVDWNGGELPLPASPTGGRIARSIDLASQIVQANPAKPDIGALPSDVFGTIELRDGRIVAPNKGKDADLVTGINGQATWATLNGAATLSVNGIWHGETVQIDASSPKPLLFFAGAATPVTASLKAAPATLAFDGTASLGDNAFFDGQAKFAAPSLRHALDWAGTSIAPGSAIGSVSVSSKVNGSANRAKFENTEITLDKNPGMGALDLSFADSLPVVSGTLAFDTLDLGAFLSAFSSQPIVSDQDIGDIDTSFADRMNLDLRLSAAHATVGSIQLADVAATAQIKDGLAVFDISDASAFGGNVQSSLRLDRKPDGTKVELKLLASDINGAAFGDAAGMKRLMPTGTGTVSVILNGPGKAWNSIFENADGSVSATFGPGTLTGLNLPAFLKHNEQGGFFPLDDVADGTVPIDGAELKASISNGVARIDKAEASSAQTKIWLSGIVPYAGRGLALSGGISQPVKDSATQTSGTQAAGQGQNPPASDAYFFVGGTWSKPFISPINRKAGGN